MSEKFLIKFFAKLKPADFKKDKFLQAFHKFYRKEKSDSLFECYIEYITKNTDFKEDERDLSLRKLYDDMKAAIMTPTVGVSTSTYESAYTNETAVINKPATSGKISKSRALDVLSDFIKQSFIITYDDPDKEFGEKDEAFMESTTCNIIDEIQSDGRALPDPKPDAVFGQRSDMLNIWQNTRQRCMVMMENQQLHRLVSKVFYIDSGVFTDTKTNVSKNVNTQPVRQGLFVSQDIVPVHVVQKSTQLYTPIAVKPIKQETLSTVLLTTDDGRETILPVENFISCYSNATYNTIISLSNNHPIQEITKQTKLKNKSIYICSGSQNICGGNADQGIDIAESMLYMTSSYSISLEKTLHAFPIKSTEVIICPNVLVFKDTDYKFLDTNHWQKIAVMMAPCKYRPKTNLVQQNECEMDVRLYEPGAELSQQDYDRIKTNLVGGIETSLFFGYDTIVIDDLSISDNWLPAHQIAKIIASVVNLFKGRVLEFIICANKAKSFNVLKLYL